MYLPTFQPIAFTGNKQCLPTKKSGANFIANKPGTAVKNALDSIQAICNNNPDTIQIQNPERLKKHIDTFFKKGASLPMMLGIAGGAGSGKSTITETILSKIGLNQLDNSLSTDSYMVALWPVLDALKKLFTPLNKDYLRVFNQIVDQDNFNRYDSDLLCSHLRSISQGKPTRVRAKTFSEETKYIDHLSRLFITEGLFSAHSKIKDFNDFNFFIEASHQVQELRIKKRYSTGERKKPPKGVLQDKLKKIFISDKYNITPTAINADFLIKKTR
jgi:uridine kinase